MLARANLLPAHASAISTVGRGSMSVWRSLVASHYLGLLKITSLASSSRTALGRRSRTSITRIQGSQQRPSSSAEMRREGSRRISPSCRSCYARLSAMVSVRHAHGEALSIPVRPRMGAPARSSASKALNYHTRQRIRASRTTQAHCVKDCTLASGSGITQPNRHH